MRKKEFEELSKLTDLERSRTLSQEKWREYMAYRFKDKPHIKHAFHPLKKNIPDVERCIEIHNRGNDKVREGMRKILLGHWGVGDSKDDRQPDYVEELSKRRFNRLNG